MTDRQQILTDIEQNPQVDVLIIGGGVNGVGTFRDLALQGVNVLLLEKDDFCSSASASSSHMLHGGIRYLENGEFRLVREALHERNRMLINAPHYSKPLPTTIPIFKWFSGLLNAPLKFAGLLERPSERGAAVIKAGLIMYDLFTGPQQTMPRHSMSLRPKSLQQYPKLHPDVVCTATYYDGFMPYPERIVLEMVMDAEQASDKARALNYARVTDGGGNSVTFEDDYTGKSYIVQPKTVINAGGPYIDFVNRAMNQETNFIGGTKGSHLIIDHPELLEALGGHEFFFENDDGRIVLLLPYLNRVMAGTTDIRVSHPDEATTSEDEIQYILGMVKRVFPDIEVDREDILYHFCGVRPLPSSEDSRTGTISRDHSIRTVGPSREISFPIHSLIGGKWTTFRAFSEKAADVALKDINQTRKVSTDQISIGGGKNYPDTDEAREAWLTRVQASTELERDHLTLLFERYGTYAEEVAKFISADTDEEIPELATFGYTRREITFIAQHERVVRLSDVVMRRSLIAMLGYLTKHPELLDTIGHITGEALGWTDEQTQEEITATRDLLRQKHGVV